MFQHVRAQHSFIGPGITELDLLVNDLNKAESDAIGQMCEELRDADIMLTTVNQDEYNKLQANKLDEERQGVLLVANHGTRESVLESVLEMLNQFETPIYGYIYMD